MCAMAEAWDAEFSLAMHNRTGKYFLGQMILRDHASIIEDVYYWRCTSSAVPSGYRARVLGKLMHLETRARQSRCISAVIPRLRPKRPILHLDPCSVALHALEPQDMVLCHDLGPVTHPDLFAPGVVTLYQRIYEDIARCQPHLVFVSEASRRAFREIYGDLPRTAVIYPPIRTGFSAAAPGTAPEGAPSSFILTVGSIGARKNQAATIAAYASSGLAKAGVDFVLCGSREPGWEKVAALAAATPGVRLLPYVSDEELVWLYDHAAGFVLVSRLKGFGMPVAEAVGRGLVPLISGDSALQEVAGPAALAADPTDREAIARGLLRLCGMTETERAMRRVALQAAVTRFTRAAFTQQWRQILLREPATVSPRRVSRSRCASPPIMTAPAAGEEGKAAPHPRSADTIRSARGPTMRGGSQTTSSGKA